MSLSELATLPDHPGSLFETWLLYAAEHSGMTNHNVMMLATVDEDGRPSVRPVLEKGIDASIPSVRFFTNYQSRKGRAIAHEGRVSVVWHWDSLERQVRVEGVATRVADEVSDAYFATRARESQLGAWASEQSQPLENWQELVKRIFEIGMENKEGAIPRPPHWGGFEIVADRVEFWEGGAGRVHQRVEFVRDGDRWRSNWVNP